MLLPLKSPEEWFNHITGLSGWKCSLLIFPTSIQIALSFYVSSTVLRQNRNTDFLRYIYIYIYIFFFFCCWWCQTCFLVYFFPLPFKILIIYIKKNSQLLFANRYDPKVPPVSIIWLCEYLVWNSSSSLIICDANAAVKERKFQLLIVISKALCTLRKIHRSN